MNKRQKEEALDLLRGTTADVADGNVSKIQIAQEEIDYAKRKHQKDEEYICKVLPWLTPSALLKNTGNELYARHCKELIRRWVNIKDSIRHEKDRKEEMLRVTNAEIAAFLTETMAYTSTEHISLLMYRLILSRVFPNRSDIYGKIIFKKDERKAVLKRIEILRKELSLVKSREALRKKKRS